MKNREMISRQQVWMIPEYRNYSRGGIYKMYNRFLRKCGKPVGKGALLSISELCEITGMTKGHVLSTID